MIKSVNKLSEYYLKISKKDLLSLTDNVNKYYNTFTKRQVKSNGDVKLREITEATGILKDVNKKILKNILYKIDYPSPPFIGGLKRKCNILNAQFHKGKPYKFCTDLKNFFPNIKYQMVYNSFLNRGFSYDVAKILTELTTYNGGLIQGGINSTYIAYLTLWETVEELSVICEKNEIVFTVFVDDITFSSHKNFKELSITLRDLIIKNGFLINHKKTFFTKGKADITGVKVGQNTLNVKNSFREKLKNTEGLTEKQKQGLTQYFNRVINYGKK